MEIVYHLGAPCTDGERLVRSLLKNRAALADEGVAVPPPSSYRKLVREAAASLEGAQATPETRASVLDAVLDGETADRLVLSNPQFVCINRLVVDGAQIWPMIARRALVLRNLFPRDAVEFHVGLRDPATFIPALFKASKFTDFAEFTENMQPTALRWSETLTRMRNAVPDVRITVWCNEDTPLIWGELMHELAGVGPLAELEGGDDLVAAIMEPSGLARMEQWLTANPPETEVQRRRVVAAFLDKYARDDAIEEEVDAPGWSQAMVDEMSAAYEEDVERIARMPGIDMVTP